MRKRTITLWVLSPFILILALIALLLSPLGTPVIRYAAVQVVPGLSIDDIDGTILSDFTAEGVIWQNDVWQVEVGRATVNLNWRCLMTPSVCIEAASVDGLLLKQIGEAPPDDEPPSDEPVKLPLHINIDAFHLTDARIELADQSIHLGELTTRGEAFEEIKLDTLQLSKLRVKLPAPQAPAPSAPPASFALSYTAPELPEIKTPIPVSVKDFLLSDTIIAQGDQEQVIARASFASLEFEEARLEVNKLHVEHTLVTANADADITFTGSYPLKLKADTTLAITEDQQESLNITANGSLADLAVALEAEGLYNARLTAAVNLLDSTLPVKVGANWQEQPLPAMEQGTLHQGELTLTGTMGQYALKGKAAATVPDIGRVPVNVDVVLNSENITVNTFDADILNGSVSNTGTLYLNESISWEGRTTLKGISTLSLTDMGPSDLNGHFTSLMQLTPKGPEVSITDLSIDGKQGKWPLHVDGSVVYSVPNNIAVASLRLEQEGNRVAIAGQVFKQRYLNGTIDIDLSEINTLYPGLSGALTGKIKTFGEWTNPKADGALALKEVRISPLLNTFAAEQGPLNGNIELGGELTRHHADVDAHFPDHKLQLAVTGGWNDNRWKGTIEKSELGILTTQWTLQAPFDIAFRPDPIGLKVTQNCWNSRAEGNLCIEDILYKDNKMDWQIEATSLPTGLWAHELLPNVIPEVPDSVLNIRSMGEIGPNEPMRASFSLNMTTAPWKLGKEQQVTLTLSEFTAEGKFADEVLNASARLVTKELGAVNANLTTRPMDETPELNGAITFKEINVAPLMPLSPAIRQLSGNLNGNIEIAGTPASPTLNGEIKLQDAALDVKDMPVSISQWQQSLTLNGQQAAFNGSFLLGEGKGALSGDISWADTPKVNIKLKGNRFGIRQRDIRMQVSPDLQASVQPGKVKVTGGVSIPWARIKIEELPQNAVTPSKDVHLRGEPPSEDPLDIIDAVVKVNIDKEKSGEVKLDAFGLTANLHGAITVNTQPAIVGYGDLRILDGKYQAYGQDLIIQTGEVQFNGPIDQPFLLVEAVRDPRKTDDGVVAGIRIDGPADNPTINLFSEPAMNQGASLAYLLTGKGDLNGGGNTNYNAVLLGLGLSNTESLTSKVGDALGIDDFSIGTTTGAGGSETKVSVAGRLNDRLTVQYNFDVGLGNNDSASRQIRRRQEAPDLAVRYQLLPRLFLEGVQTSIEEQTEFALDLYYEFFLGENRPAQSEDDTDESEEAEPAASDAGSD